MKYAPGRSAALPLMFIAIVTRLFCEMALLYPAAHNAAWLCPIAGLILYLPFAFALQRAAALGNDSAWGNLESRLPRFLSALILLILGTLLLLDASAMTDIAAGTGYTVENGQAVFSLRHGESLTFTSLPYGAVVTVTETDHGGYAVTNSSRSGDSGAVELTGAASLQFVNTKRAVPDMGLPTPTALPVFLLAGACGALALLRRRRHTL